MARLFSLGQLNGRNRATTVDEVPGDAETRSERTAARLQQECAVLTAEYRIDAEYGLDPHCGFWVRLADWPLPLAMNRRSCPLIVMVPPDFPASGPETFFFPANIAANAGWKVSELFPSAGEAVGPENWQACRIRSVPWREHDDLPRILAVLSIAIEAACRVA